VCYRAKTFAGHEHTKTANKVIAKREKGEIAPHSTFKWETEKIALPSVPPKLSRCRIIDVTYTLELEVQHFPPFHIPPPFVHFRWIPGS
jgi:hypothetical protein